MEELIRNTLNGDKHSFEVLIDSVKSDLYRVAQAKLSNIRVTFRPFSFILKGKDKEFPLTFKSLVFHLKTGCKSPLYSITAENMETEVCKLDQLNCDFEPNKFVTFKLNHRSVITLSLDEILSYKKFFEEVTELKTDENTEIVDATNQKVETTNNRLFGKFCSAQ